MADFYMFFAYLLGSIAERTGGAGGSAGTGQGVGGGAGGLPGQFK